MKNLLTTKEAAEFLNCSKSWLEKGRWAGYGPRYVKLGRKVLYPREDLQVLLEEHHFSSTVEYSVTTQTTDNM